MFKFFRKARKKYLSVSNFKASKDWLSEIAYEFELVEEKVLVDLMLRGQRASPIYQHDVDGAMSTAEILVSQKICTCESSIKFLTQEISDLLEQLSKPLDLDDMDKKEDSFSNKVILFKNKFRRDRKHERKANDIAQKSGK